MWWACSFCKDMNMSVLSDVGVFLVLVAILRKMMAAYERDWQVSTCQQSCARTQPSVTGWTYSRVFWGRNLFGQAHQQNLWPGCNPVALEVLLGLGPNPVVSGLERLQELGQLGVDIRRQHRHVGQ